MRTLRHFLKSGGAALTMVVLAVFMATATPAEANNIRLLGRPKVINKDTSTHTVQILFDIAWDNSWKTARPNNWDAAWIYVKVWDGGSWNHVYLEDTMGRPGPFDENGVYDARLAVTGTPYKVSDKTGKKFDAPMVLEPGYSMGYYAWEPGWAEDEEPKEKLCTGFFLHRKEFGTGDVVVPGVCLTWMYEKQLFSDVDDFTVKVFAVEMVYVPKGGFSLGGRGTKEYQTGSFTGYNDEFGHPFHITGEQGIPVENDNGDSTLWAIDNAITEGRIPEEFPKGHAAFYIMKYELSQQAWCEFLNTLNYFQQQVRMDAPLDSLQVGDGILGEISQMSWKFKSQPQRQSVPGNRFYTAGVGSHFDGYVSTGRPKTLNDTWIYKLGIHDQKLGFRHYVRVKQNDPEFVFACDDPFSKGTAGVYNEVDTISYEHPDGAKNTERMIRNVDGQDIAMFWVSPRDLFAYACFAALRPMTEFEFEKACRGARPVVNDEYAWGTSNANFFGQGWSEWGGPEKTTGLSGYDPNDPPTDGTPADPVFDGTKICCPLAGHNREIATNRLAWELIGHADTTGLVSDMSLGTEYLSGYNCGYTRNVGWFNDNSAYDKYWKGEYWIPDPDGGTDWCYGHWRACWKWWDCWNDHYQRWQRCWGWRGSNHYDRSGCCNGPYKNGSESPDKLGRTHYYWGTLYSEQTCSKGEPVRVRHCDSLGNNCEDDWEYPNPSCSNVSRWWKRYNIYDYNFTNYMYQGWSLPSPLRVGCFADSTTGREGAGASFWGVMNLSDNVAEICISAYGPKGWAFKGEHGTGQLDYLTGEPLDMYADWAIPGGNTWEDNQYIIERGMCFQYSNVIPNGSVLITSITGYLYGETGDKRFLCPTPNACSYTESRNNLGYSQGWKENEFWWRSGNGNKLWAQNAGMVSNRCRYVNGLEYVTVNGQPRRDSAERQYLNTRSIMWQDSLRTELPKVHNPIMRGIRCVHTQDPKFVPTNNR